MKKFWQILERNQLCKCICSGFFFPLYPLMCHISFSSYSTSSWALWQCLWRLNFLIIWNSILFLLLSLRLHTHRANVQSRFLLLIERKLEFLRGWRVWHYVHRRHSGNLNPKAVIYIQCFKYCGVYTASHYFLGVQKLYDLWYCRLVNVLSFRFLSLSSSE